MARRSGNVMRSGRLRRATQWIGFPITQDTLVGLGANNFVLFGNAALEALAPFTVIRTRGFIFAASDQAGVTEDVALAYGHCVVNAAAISIGVTALPAPDTDVSADFWYVYEQVVTQFTFLSSVGIQSVGGVLKYFDSKAARKVEEGQNIISMAETSTTSEGVALTTGFRTLIKLH